MTTIGENTLAEIYGAKRCDDNDCRFELNGWHIWQSGPSFEWITGRIADGHYRDRKCHATLRDALEFAQCPFDPNALYPCRECGYPLCVRLAVWVDTDNGIPERENMEWTHKELQDSRNWYCPQCNDNVLPKGF